MMNDFGDAVEKSSLNIVMGDGANDMSMFEMSGYKVAMENGNEELKKKADYITANNNQDGVARALEEIFNKGE